MLSDLDWDVKAGKFTLRTYDYNSQPFIVFVIIFRKKDNTIIISDITNKKQFERQISLDDKYTVSDDDEDSVVYYCIVNYLQDLLGEPPRQRELQKNKDSESED